MRAIGLEGVSPEFARSSALEGFSIGLQCFALARPCSASPGGKSPWVLNSSFAPSKNHSMLRVLQFKLRSDLKHGVEWGGEAQALELAIVLAHSLLALFYWCQ